MVFFTHLISRLTENYHFNILIDARDQSTTPLYKNHFKFSFEKLDVISREHDCIQVTVEQLVPENSSAECQPPEEVCSSARKKIYITGQSIVQQWMPRITVYPCFYCRHCSEDHFATLHNMGPPILLSCTKTMKIFAVAPQEMMWLRYDMHEHLLS